MTQIHPTAIVHPEAKIGEGVAVGAYAVIGQFVSLGDGTEVMPHSIIDGRTTIGKNNKIYPSASIGLPPQDLKYQGEPTKLVIGDNNHIREFSTIHLSATLDEDTTVGSNNLIMAYAHIAHNCQIGNNIVLANAVQLAGHVHIHDNVVVGGLSAISQFVRIGAYAFLGGCSGLNKDVPPFTRGQGMRKYIIAGINSIGLSRKGFTPEQIEAIKQIYKIFYRSKLGIFEAIEQAEQIANITAHQQMFLDFCKNSTRGIIRNSE